MPGSGPTWATGYVSLPDKDGVSHLVGAYMKIKQPMDMYKRAFAFGTMPPRFLTSFA